MLNCLITGTEIAVKSKNKRLARLVCAGKAAACALVAAALATACDTTASGPAGPAKPATNALPTVPPPAAVDQSTNSTKPLVLQEGDTLKIDFPGAPSLNTVQAIRRDGKITLAQIGEYDAAGKSPAAVEADLKRLYGPQLVNSDVTVTVQSSGFVIYVTGAVDRPGKIVSERPLDPLEALIEAGIDNTRSNIKAVWVIRTDSAGHTTKTKLNLYKILHSKNGQMPDFTLKPLDVLYVPERFSLF